MRHFPDPFATGPGPMIPAEAFGFILAHGLRECAAGRGPLTARLGLSGADLAALRDRFAPGLDLPDLDLPRPVAGPDQQAIETLILWRAGVATPEARWLAAILARRAMETRHLWEDLGLPSRPALSAMIAQFLPGLAAANSRNMRWKKFFYRQICSDAAFSLCLSPSCDDCDERAACFAPD
ncbi:nitrogen fixation protein NifQ [Rhodobacter capsulatus]|nr:nitrogen fixation protein NifQ [Rhodobacter capsulatus]KQB15457.1 nitrogen fixation protein NifQ [Rhodobacter capsulatus]KQB16636.1 nitrogen fixation protein NifQ [Rhodobacter capsulatus]QNR63009.1 nitrogen fixation protein NifQ [Rhodobacter capsulatus]